MQYDRLISVALVSVSSLTKCSLCSEATRSLVMKITDGARHIIVPIAAQLLLFEIFLLKRMKKQTKKEIPHPTLDPKRAVSWSMLSAFAWNREQWWKKYIGKELPEDTPELRFGKYVDERIQAEPEWLPNIIRYPILQHEMRVEYCGIPLVGIADAYRPEIKGKNIPKNSRKVMGYGSEQWAVRPALRDYKTGRKPWTQKRADETGQLTMYCLMLYLTEGIRPEDVELYIDWMPTHIVDGEIAFIKEGEVVTFKTKRTMREVLKFGQFIIDEYAAMHTYAAKRPILDTSDYSQW